MVDDKPVNIGLWGRFMIFFEQDHHLITFISQIPRDKKITYVGDSEKLLL